MPDLNPQEVSLSVRHWVERETGHTADVEVRESHGHSALCVTVDALSIWFDLDTIRECPELVPQLLRRHLRTDRVA